MALPSVRRLSAMLSTSNSHQALCAGAQIYFNYLSLTRRSGFLQGHISKQTDSAPEEAAHARTALEVAAARHLAFMELRKELPTAVPTRDISVMWHSDLLRPTVGVINQDEEAEKWATAWFDHAQHRLLQSAWQSGATFEEATGRRWSGAHALWRAGTLAAWQYQYGVTDARWRDKEATEYCPGADKMAVVGPRPLADVAEQQRRSALAAELADAVASQASFAGRILALGPNVISSDWIERAVTRYGHFLALARAHPGEMLVPTLDVDLIWHVHMLTPLDYRDDCEAMLGRLLSHDAQVGDTELAHAFERTKSRWRASHDTSYVVPYALWPDAPHRSTAYSGCGSCGWGDADFHAQLDHTQEEAVQIEHAYDEKAAAANSINDGAAILTSDVRVGEGMEVSEQQAWASDASSPVASGGGDEGAMSDPWAAPASSADCGGAGSWGWDGCGDDSDGWDGGDCGGGCGGD
jgi:hypothetical protein